MQPFTHSYPTSGEMGRRKYKTKRLEDQDKGQGGHMHQLWPQAKDRHDLGKQNNFNLNEYSDRFPVLGTGEAAP